MKKPRRKPIDRERALERMQPDERLALFMAINEIRHYLDSAPNSRAVVDANRLCFAAKLRGVKLPVKAFVTAMDWLDKYQSR